MTAHRLRAALAASAAVLALATAGVPAHAQWIVFDPTNFSQNVLTAARELQQVNNEIQSLENQGHDADQPGQEPGEPALLGAGAA